MTGQEALDKIRECDFATLTAKELDEICEAILPTQPITEEIINGLTAGK